MELIKINDKKLKVMLSDLDLKCYNLNCDNIDYDCAATKTAFRRILADAKEQTGFDTEEDRIFVQIYPGLGGGCEMYVTRLSEEHKDRIHTVRTAYIFNALEPLLCACRLLVSYAFRDESELYTKDGKYYLLISEDYKQNNSTYSVGGRGRTLPSYPLLSEYGRRVSSEKFIDFLREHAAPICERNAVETMSRL